MSGGLTHTNCSLCGSLADREESFSKAGQDTGNTSLPPAARDLILVQDRTGVSSRAKQLKKCPQCDTHYWYWTDYEFLVGGTEDEEFLIRLRPEQIGDYREPTPEAPPKTEETPDPQAEHLQAVIKRSLSQDQWHQLLTVFESFEASKVNYEQTRHQRYYRPVRDLRSAKVMAKLHGEIKTAWNVLYGLLQQLGIGESALADIVLPKRMKGGKRNYRRLTKWLSMGGHQLTPSLPPLAKYDYRQLLRELLDEALVVKWGFGLSLSPGAHTEPGVPAPSDTAHINSLNISIPYYTGFFVVDFKTKKVRLMAVDMKTPAEQHWQLDPAADWWSRARCCDWPIYGK